MVELWDEYLMWSKYHISVCKRLIDNYKNYEEKRFLISIIDELAISTSFLINSFLVYSKIKYNILISKKADERLKTLGKQIKNNVITKEDFDILLKVIRIKKILKKSPIQYQRNEKILILNNQKYSTISIDILNNLCYSVDNIIRKFPS